MKQENSFSEENLIAMIRNDCLRQAKTVQAKLKEVVECLGDENHLGALGSFVGLDEDIACLKVFLTRIASLTVGTTSNRFDQPTQKGEKQHRARKTKTRHSI